MLTSRERRRLEIPHEPGEWIEIRLVSWEKLQQARQARLDGALDMARRVGMSLEGIQQTGERAEAKDSDKYDRGTLLRSAVVAWSYDARVTPDNVADLDEQTAGWLVEQIVAYQAEDRTKN